MAYSPTLGRWTRPDPAGYVDGPNLYEYVQSRPVDLTDPTGLTPACKINGQELVLTFDGETLSGGGEKWAAASGKPSNVGRTYYTGSEIPPAWRGMVDKSPKTTTYQFFYHQNQQKIKDQGPIPEGTYTFEVCEENSSKNRWRHYLDSLLGGAWGQYSYSLSPAQGTNTFGRSGFFIHGGQRWGSEGCIDLRNNDVSLHNLIEKARQQMKQNDPNSDCCCHVKVVVKYMKPVVNVVENHPPLPDGPTGPGGI